MSIWSIRWSCARRNNRSRRAKWARPHGRQRRLDFRSIQFEQLEDRTMLSAVQPAYVVFHPTGMAPDSGRPVGYTPAQIQGAYGVSTLLGNGDNGSGQTIALIDAYYDPNIVSDLNAFCKQFSLPTMAPTASTSSPSSPTFLQLEQDGSTITPDLPGPPVVPGHHPPVDPSGPGNNDWEGEEALDVEWAHSMAPEANIILFEANDATAGPNIAIATARTTSNVSVISMSYGLPEGAGTGNSLTEETWENNHLYTTPTGHEGITFLASTGDEVYPSWPALSPNVVGVGGTQVMIAGDTYIRESGWYSGGGGPSIYQYEPIWQTGVQQTSYRTIPDVSSDAASASGVAVYDSYDNPASPWSEVGGTSLSSPSWAGLIAIADQMRVADGLGTLDGPTQTLPYLYSLPTSDFNDITTGTNGVYAAGPGYDELTGIGSPQANLIVPALATTPSIPTTMALSVSDSTPVYSQPVTITVSIAGVPQNSGVPNGGTVTFYDNGVLLPDTSVPISGNDGQSWVTNGTAAYTTSCFAPGTQQITAVYNGDGLMYLGCTTSVGPDSTITTVAGNGKAGYKGNGGQATDAELQAPGSVAVDSSGDLFIADTANNTVREVNASTGVITTVAGTGTAGYNGDSIQATAAKLNAPDGVAVDSSGDLFIADTGNNRIREVVLGTGVITTVAGTGTAGYNADSIQATAAELNAPDGMAVDSSGDLFIADTGNNRIREVYGAGAGIFAGVITTVAGSGTPGFAGDGSLAAATNVRLQAPQGVTVDSDGDLFIADTKNNRIREVNNSTDIITTVAGNGVAGFNGDGILATATKLNAPEGVAIDSSGNLFIGDTGNNRIREINPTTYLMSTVAGSSVANYGGDGGVGSAALLHQPGQIAVDAYGDVFVADTGNNVVRELATALPIAVAKAPTSTAVAVSSSWSAYGDALTLTATIGVVAPATATPTGGTVEFLDNTTAGATIIGTATLTAGTASMVTTGLTVGPHMLTAIYLGDTADFANSSSSIVPAITTGSLITTVVGNGTTGSSGDGGQATAAELSSPSGVVVDAEGDLFIADSSNNVVREVVLGTGVINTVAGDYTAGYSGDHGPATAAELNAPTALALDGSGDLFITDSGNNVVREVNLSTGVITTVAGNGNWSFLGDGGPAVKATFNGLGGLAVADGDLFIADTGNQRVREVNLATGIINTMAGDGNTGYVTDNVGATTTSLFNPTGVAVDASGNLYIADTGNHRIREVLLANPSTGTGGPTIITVAGNGAGRYGGDGGLATLGSLADPVGIVLDSLGNLYIADSGNDRIREVYGPAAGALSGTITTVAGNGSTGFAGDSGLATAAVLHWPTSLAIDSGGDLFIADQANQRVREIDRTAYVDVIPATLVVLAQNVSRPYGSPDPTFTANISGFVNGEIWATSGSSGSPVLTSNDTISSPAGSYTINVALGTLFSQNYTFLPVSGTLSIIATPSLPGLYVPGSVSTPASVFFLRDSNTTGVADTTFGYGPASATWVPIAGDWTGSGTATIGLYNPTTATFFLRNSNSSGVADTTFSFGWVPAAGKPDLVPIAGDWTGNGTTEVGLYDPSTATFFLDYTNSAGPAGAQFSFGWVPAAGKPALVPIAGDWTGSGTTKVGLYDPSTSTFFLDYTNSAGPAGDQFGFGWVPTGSNAALIPLAGNWSGSSASTIGLYDPTSSTFFERNVNAGGAADAAFSYGAAGAGWLPLTGYWTTSAGSAAMPAASPLAVGSAAATTVGAPPIPSLAAAALPALPTPAATAIPDIDLSDVLAADTLGSLVATDGAAASSSASTVAAPSSLEQSQTLNPAAVDHVDLSTLVDGELGQIAGLDDIAAANGDLAIG